MPPLSDPNSRASKARDRMNADFRECVRLGLLVGMPGRLTPGKETRISRARAELKRMKEQDRELATLRQAGDLEALSTETNAQAWQRLHDKSINFFDKVLSENIPLNLDNAALIRIQNDTAQKVITISQKVAIERFRAQNIGALARVIERMRSRGVIVEHEEPEPQHRLFEPGPNAVTVAEIPETVGFDEG